MATTVRKAPEGWGSLGRWRELRSERAFAGAFGHKFVSHGDASGIPFGRLPDVYRIATESDQEGEKKLAGSSIEVRRKFCNASNRSTKKDFIAKPMIWRLRLAR